MKIYSFFPVVLFVTIFSTQSLEAAGGNFTINDKSGESCVSTGGTLSPKNLFTDLDNGSFGTGSGAPDEIPQTDPYGDYVSGGTFTNSFDVNFSSGEWWGKYTYISNLQKPRNGWNHGYGIYDPVNGPTGRFFVSDPNEDTPSFSHTLNDLIKGQSYEVSFWAADSDIATYHPNRIGIFADGVEVYNTGDIENVPNQKLEWKKYFFVYKHTNNKKSITFDIKSLETGGGGNDFFLDEIKIYECFEDVTIPPPAFCSMDSLGHGDYTTGSVAHSSDDLTKDTLVYKASFNSDNWHGDLSAYSLKTTDADGNIKSEVWRAASQIKPQNRKLFTYTPAFNKGRRFEEDQLSDQQRITLSSSAKINTKLENIVAWVKGTDGSLRKRTSKLGDIIHSNLNYASRHTNFGYKELAGTEGTSYAAYLTAKRNKSDTIFVGANDGMLHAFEAETGKELFGFVPNETLPKIVSISDPKYGCDKDDCLPHEYVVDGKSIVADAYIKKQWRNILVGTLGLGGKSVFALDVTNASSFNEQNVLWEISDKQARYDAAVYSDHMGLSIPEPVVVKMKNGRWVAVVANGYESKENQAVLFIIDIETSKLLKSINTSFDGGAPTGGQGDTIFGGATATQNNGLSSPVAVDSDGDYITDVIYAGDLQGNLWAFDVSSANVNNWKVKHSGLPLFRACMDTSCALPKRITAKPQVGRNPAGGLMVYFGTGKYTDLGDNFESDQKGVIDTFYGLHDDGRRVIKSKLIQQKILQELTFGADLRSRVTSDNKVPYPESQGWYMDLLTPPSTQDNGERVISQAILREGRLIFVTLSPTQDECAWDGDSWLMELNAVDGSRLSVIPIDLNNDKEFTEEDNVDYKGSSTIVSGVQQPSVGMVFEPPAIISHGPHTEGKYQTGSSGEIGMIRESASSFSGRMSWRQLR